MNCHPDDVPVWKVLAVTGGVVALCGLVGFVLLMLTRMGHA